MLRASLFWRINREERVVILYRLLFDFFHKLKLFYLINSYLFILYIYIVTPEYFTWLGYFLLFVSVSFQL